MSFFARTPLTRWIVAAYVLATMMLTVVAIVAPATATLLCSASGSRWVVTDDEGTETSAGLGTCVLCVVPGLAAAPVLPQVWDCKHPNHLAAAVIDQWPCAGAASAPLPPRGPPTAA